MRYAPILALLAFLTACGLFEHEDRHDTPRADIPVVDEGGLSGRPKYCQDPGTLLPSSSGNGATFGTEAQRATVRSYIKTLMDHPRLVPASEGHPAETRGGPGNFDKLDAKTVDEFVAGIIYGADKFYPKSLPSEQKWAMIAAEISAECAFQPNTRGPNPGDTSQYSAGVLQFTTPTWLPLFKQYAKLPGLVHFDGSQWNVADTTAEMVDGRIWDNMQASLWAITEQGRRGAPLWLGGPDGTMQRTIWTGMLCWVIGAPAASSGGDLASQKAHYRNMISVDVQLLGFDPSILDSSF